MRLFAGIWCASIALRACAASTGALVYVSDSTQTPSIRANPSISPNTARLLLAQRLGLDLFHHIGDADESTLGILNTYGGKQRDVFEEESSGCSKLLLIVEGVEYPEDIIRPDDAHILSIAEPPSPPENKRLALDLLEQDQHLKYGRNERCSLLPADGSATLSGGVSVRQRPHQTCSLFKATFPNERSPPAGYSYTSILHSNSLQGLNRQSDAYKTALLNLNSLRQNHSTATPNLETTLILLPPHHPKNQQKRHTLSSPYGTYSMPHPRTLPRTSSHPESEEILSAPFSTTNPQSVAASSPHPNLLQTTPPPLPKGILPICHPTLDACIATTNNCSSHGTPYKKSSGDIDCYACRCGKTTTVTEKGQKTVFWGGPACQKKDVSVPFFLLAGLTVVLLGVAGWGVGLLVAVGGEELPSVIGAGVAGPRAGK